MLGPALGVRGGISAVERALIGALPPHVHVRHVASMDEGSKLGKLATFLGALATTWRRTGERPDVVHIHFASRASSVRKMALARIALARGCKVILHAHGGAYPQYWKTLPAWQRRRNLEVLRRAEALIVLGEVWRDFFVDIGVPAERIVVLPNPVVLPAEVPARTAARTVLFVYLGLISRAKGTFDLVEAIARLSAETRARLRVVIAGNGENDALGRRIAELALGATIEVRAWLSETQRDALLAAAQAFVLPSHHEGLPMALLEAMAWGLAPIATPVGAIGEVLEHEANGLVTAPGDIDALARAIERVTLDRALRTRLGEAARRRVEPLDVDHYAQKLCQLYEAVKCRN